MEEILEVISEGTAKLTIPLTFTLVIIYVLRKIGKGKDKNHFINVWNRRLRKAHKPMGIILAIVSLIHGITSQIPVLWGIVCCISIFLLGLNYLLRKKIKKPNWIKIHRILAIIMIITFVLHMVEIKTKEHDYDHDDERSIITYQREY